MQCNNTNKTKDATMDERIYTTNCRTFDRPVAEIDVSKCHSFELTCKFY